MQRPFLPFSMVCVVLNTRFQTTSDK